ncbi:MULTISPECIES: hypothetical protein [unclassified Yoonia]|uniref:hypothetical protein n=1 Tax=unclassified Yoonia TaxID=2629118 RepID=UPI002AFDD929|nr:MULTISPECIES: hypothetical protein [unclassified Yoonia]
MTEQTKILDVTYGTFSCRLEGFDDSVETMKQVVGYFHELAGHERFLNTALLAPDMDELALLTGAQSGGAVDAGMDEGKLRLRLREGADAQAPQSDSPEPEPTLDYDETDEDLADLQDADAADDLAEGDADQDAPDARFDEDSVAAKLERIRAVVGRGHVTEPADSYAEDLADDDSIAPRGGVNPLAQRLAELAKRNSELAAIEAGVPLTQDEVDRWDEFDAQDEADLAALDGDDAETFLPHDEDMTPDTEQDVAIGAEPEHPFLDEDEDEDDEDLHLANLVANEGLDLHEEVAEVERVIEDRNKRNELSRTADAAVSRILSHTDAELNQPEHRRQQDAFAQLKAAVAATEAARLLGDDGGPKRRPSAVYRHDLGEFEAEADRSDAFAEQPDDEDDLTDALDPADAEDESADITPPVVTPRPVTTLRLVASQRTDTPVDPASQRLRQIAAKVDTTAPRTMGFAEFADEYAATDLEDMIEAGAAYITYLLEEEDFSRPQVMKLVQTLTNEEISREDGLRCFGRLLRQNRIIKLDNGRFQVAPGTRFRPDDLSARG